MNANLHELILYSVGRCIVDLSLINKGATIAPPPRLVRLSLCRSAQTDGFSSKACSSCMHLLQASVGLCSGTESYGSN